MQVSHDADPVAGAGHTPPSPPPSIDESIAVLSPPLSIVVPDEELPMPDELLPMPDELLPEPDDELLEPPSSPVLDEVVLHPGCAATIASPAIPMTTADKATLFMCLSQSVMWAAVEAAQASLDCAREVTSQCAYRENFRRIASPRMAGMTFVSRCLRVTAEPMW
jgi:hypothetical protein